MIGVPFGDEFAAEDAGLQSRLGEGTTFAIELPVQPHHYSFGGQLPCNNKLQLYAGKFLMTFVNLPGWGVFGYPWFKS